VRLATTLSLALLLALAKAASAQSLPPDAVASAGCQCVASHPLGVAKKGEFAVGSLGVYFEIDAIPPDLPPYQFLWTPKKEPLGSVPRPPKARIKTFKAISNKYLLDERD
jgi:hypothetical protein